MRMVIEFDVDNAAFRHGADGDCGNPEVKRILKDISESLPFPDGHRVIKDINGNTVGKAYFAE